MIITNADLREVVLIQDEEEEFLTYNEYSILIGWHSPTDLNRICEKGAKIKDSIEKAD